MRLYFKPYLRNEFVLSICIGITMEDLNTNYMSLSNVSHFAHFNNRFSWDTNRITIVQENYKLGCSLYVTALSGCIKRQCKLL